MDTKTLSRFAIEDVPEEGRQVAKKFRDFAHDLALTSSDCPETTAALEDLIDVRDSFVAISLGAIEASAPDEPPKRRRRRNG